MSSAREGRARRTESHGASLRRSLFDVLRGQIVPAVCAVTLMSSFAPHARAQDGALPLAGLIVTATPLPRSEEAVDRFVTVLTGDELRGRGDRTVGEALRGTAGVDVARNGSFGAVTSVFLRGGESDYTLVLVDGVQVNQAGGGFDFESLTTDNVERIEILRGPASALYGSDAVTGVVHVITRSGAGPPRGGAEVRAGSHGRLDWSADLVGGTSRAGYSLSLSRRSTDGILAFNNRSVRTVMSGRVRILPDASTEVGLTVRASDRRYHFPTDGTGAVSDRNAFTFDDAMTLAVSARRVIARSVRLEALIGVRELDGGTDDAQDGPADTLGFFGFRSLDNGRRTSGEVRAHVDLGAALLTGGFELEQRSRRSFTESSSEFGVSSGQSSYERDNRAAFLHVTGEIAAVSYSLGARLEDNDRFGRFGTWQAGGSWAPSAGTGTRLRVSAGRAIKEPTFFENFATGFATGNPDLEPERSVSWELGVEQPLLSGRARARATYFDQRFEDLIQFTFLPPTPGGPSYFNVAAAASRGVEAELTARLGPLDAGVSHTWSSTEVTDSGFQDGPGATFVSGEPLLRRPGAAWSVHMSGSPASGLRLFAGLRAVGTRADRDFSTFPATPVELPSYRLVRLGGAWQVGRPVPALPELALTLEIDNLLDQRYEEVLGFRAPGRALSVGARLELRGREP